jgi:hypothetical protein
MPLPTVVDPMTAARALGIGRGKACQPPITDSFPAASSGIGTLYNVPIGRAATAARSDRHVTQGVNGGC